MLLECYMSISNKISTILPLITSSSDVLLDANTQINSSSSYIAPKTIEIERNANLSVRDNVKLVDDLSISTASTSSLHNTTFEFVCNGESVIFRLKCDIKGVWYLNTLSSSIELPSRILKLNSDRRRADLSYVMIGVAYHELGYTIQWGSNERAIQDTLQNYFTSANKYLYV